MQPETPPTLNHTVSIGCEKHAVAGLIQTNMPELYYPGYGRVQEDPRKNFRECGDPTLSNGLPHLGLSIVCPRCSPLGGAVRVNQMTTKGKYWCLLWNLPISHRFSGPNFEHHNWECFLPFTFFFDVTFSTL